MVRIGENKMVNEKFEAYVLVYPDGKLVGIDSYPYPIESFYENNLRYCWISKVELFPTEEKAKEYQKHFRELIVKKVRFNIETI